MRVRFWGTRGSIPVALTVADVRDKLARALVAASGKHFDSYGEAYAFAEQNLPFSVSQTFGGHTSCVELDTAHEEYFVCDMGSGARAFGEHVLARQSGKPATVNIFMSHVHWDHIMGFPFFGPAYVRGMRLRIYGSHDILEKAFRLQQSAPCFPVSFDQLGSTIEFKKLVPGQPTEISGLKVTTQLQRHSGDSYGYRFEHGGRSVIYSTDSEHKLEDRAQTESVVAFFRGADLVIFDAMYSLAEAISVKEDWGHSSNVAGVELCQMARARHLVLFHHEPANSDAAIEGLLRDARRLEELTRADLALQVSAAHDGLEIDL
ncbi:MAG TPA: MBL fold metallo-hydrolase [Burkholderiales bacterium]|nr:MBL fold metallo-hydrolase [Burkholderiales bacterium]